jgi:hypothetical protein
MTAGGRAVSPPRDDEEDDDDGHQNNSFDDDVDIDEEEDDDDDDNASDAGSEYAATPRHLRPRTLFSILTKHAVDIRRYTAQAVSSCQARAVRWKGNHSQ